MHALSALISPPVNANLVMNVVARFTTMSTEEQSTNTSFFIITGAVRLSHSEKKVECLWLDLTVQVKQKKRLLRSGQALNHSTKPLYLNLHHP